MAAVASHRSSQQPARPAALSSNSGSSTSSSPNSSSSGAAAGGLASSQQPSQDKPSIPSPQPKAAGGHRLMSCFGWGAHNGSSSSSPDDAKHTYSSTGKGAACAAADSVTGARHLQSQLSLDGVITHFNWDDQGMARAAMDTLVTALADDPVSAYFSGHKRRRFVKDEVKGYLKALPGATNFITTPDSLAVALWQLLPQETPANELLAGWTRFLRVPLRLWPSLFRLELHYERAHQEVAGAFGSYYYLSFIGTHPDARGKGYGSLLLKHITDRADAEGRWCLLEATSDRSQALYGRHGFETYQTYRCNPGAPPVYMMKRAPATAAAPRAVAAAALAAAAVSCKVLKVAGAAGGEEPQLAAAGADAAAAGNSSSSNPKAALSRGGSIKLVAVAVAEPAPDAIPAVRAVAPGDTTGVTSGDGGLVRVPSSCSSSSSGSSSVSEEETDSCSGSEAGVVLIEEEAASSKGTEA